MDFTGSQRVGNGQEETRLKSQPMSYEFRAGQVGRALEMHSEMSIYDLAKYLGIKRRQMHNICERMAREGLVSVRQVPHRPNMFKHLISRR